MTDRDTHVHLWQRKSDNTNIMGIPQQYEKIYISGANWPWISEIAFSLGKKKRFDIGITHKAAL